MQVSATQSQVLCYADCREGTSVVSEQAGIVPEELFDGLITTEHPCDEQVATSFSCITNSNESIMTLSMLKRNKNIQKNINDNPGTDPKVCLYGMLKRAILDG